MPVDHRDVPDKAWVVLDAELEVPGSATVIRCCCVPMSITIADGDAPDVLQSISMRQTIGVALLAAALLVSCKKSSAPTAATSPVRPDDPVQLKLKELAGAGAADCGRLDVRAPNEQLASASNCATKAAQEKHPFYVGYDMPGMSTGIAGNAEGKLFAVQLQGAGTGAQLASGPCPAELRIAKSGRATCFIPGTMGLTPTSADPHSGIPMSPAGGMTPQGGMIPQPFAPPPKKK